MRILPEQPALIRLTPPSLQYSVAFTGLGIDEFLQEPPATPSKKQRKRYSAVVSWSLAPQTLVLSMDAIPHGAGPCPNHPPPPLPLSPRLRLAMPWLQAQRLMIMRAAWCGVADEQHRHTVSSCRFCTCTGTCGTCNLLVGTFLFFYTAPPELQVVNARIAKPACFTGMLCGSCRKTRTAGNTTITRPSECRRALDAGRERYSPCVL